MNVTIPEKYKMKKKTIAIYVVIAIICVLSIIVVVEAQVLGNDIVNQLFGINKLVKRSEEEEAKLKDNFENVIDNTEEGIEDNLIYKIYEKQEIANNSEIDVSLPYININNSEAKKFNNEIISVFAKKAEIIINNEVENTIYTVKYKATVENNILSLIIYSDLKQGTNPQRIIVQTFNYDLEEGKALTFEEVAEKYKYDLSEIQSKITTDIEEEQSKSNDLAELGYNVFSRDLNDEMYKTEYISEFFIYNNNIYIIFAYGNNQMTSEMDLVII